MFWRKPKSVNTQTTHWKKIRGGDELPYSQTLGWPGLGLLGVQLGPRCVNFEKLGARNSVCLTWNRSAVWMEGKGEDNIGKIRGSLKRLANVLLFSLSSFCALWVYLTTQFHPLEKENGGHIDGNSPSLFSGRTKKKKNSKVHLFYDKMYSRETQMDDSTYEVC